MKPVYILGISAFYHDAAAALLRDGEIIAAVQEERFSRKKHDYNFPQDSINYCLKEAGITSADLSHIVFYDKPFIKFERLLYTYLHYVPRGISSFIASMPLWLKRKIFIRNLIEDKLKGPAKLLFAEHHQSHAASAFYPSPFREAAILTIDGVGEWATASFGAGKDNKIQITNELMFPHSLGLLYSAFTYYIGFKVNSGEYKLMGLAPYGEPTYVDAIKRELIDIKEDGSFSLNMKYFNYCEGLTMTNKRFNSLFGGPSRKPDVEKIEQRHMDIARSIQVVTEEIILKMASFVHKQTGQKNLCLAGGVALNCVANGALARAGIFENIWVQPAATDAGGALGAALLIWHDYLKKERFTCGRHDSMKAALLGPSFCDEEIEDYLKTNNISYEKLQKNAIAQRGAAIIFEQKVLGWFQGRMEYGPRALGNRSIIGDPRSAGMQSTINLKVKFRESFRPFAPSVLAERAREYFDLKCESPYMLFTAPVLENKRLPPQDYEEKLSGLDKLKAKRSIIPAVTHVDYSARIQTVSKEDNPLFYDLIAEFFKLTGCPCIINTSFNVRGEPIVCTPSDAYKCFARTNMDYLIMGSFLLSKDKQSSSEAPKRDFGTYEPD
ncbi:MAG: carbamoyltransferase [Candidatus Omnitrophica bacterium]|nr:carbamoyltransferase [Candidatus Omnitrophota bacterium]